LLDHGFNRGIAVSFQTEIVKTIIMVFGRIPTHVNEFRSIRLFPDGFAGSLVL